jgi:serine/threonine protein phosphatase 1
MIWNKLFRRAAPVAAPQTARFALPEGERIYAIGDIHGRLDLFDALLDKIEVDNASRPTAKAGLILLGDLVDRGPDSRGVVERAMQLAAAPSTIVLKGNHEELLLRVCAGDHKVTGPFHRVGGRDTLLSYGVSEAAYDACELAELPALAASVVPQAHRDFLESARDYQRIGDYLFVHAGIQPGVALEDQDSTSLRWIRHEFTGSDVDHGMMVIHGHTITPEVDAWPNRIGIDTGAYASGVLTAIGIEGHAHWFLQT